MRRLPLLPMLSVLAVSLAAAPPSLPLAQAETRLLEAYDNRESDERIPIPPVDRKNRAAIHWLGAAANTTVPGNPFPKGGRLWREAEAVRDLLNSSPDHWVESLRALPLSQGGSYLALWRWGQVRVRDGRMDKALRVQWEDKLLEGKGPGIVRDYALRHALCFALADADEARFAQLKDSADEDAADPVQKFQRAFALLGSPSPVLHLWRLPELKSVDLPLDQLGGLHVVIQADPGQGLPDLPVDTAWVVPTREGAQPPDFPDLVGSSLEEARQLIPRLNESRRHAYLAPVRSVLEKYALMYFPIFIDLGVDGAIRRICMGDAALARKPDQPKPTP